MRMTALLGLAAFATFPAKAAVHVVNFRAEGPWVNFGSPYGLGPDENVHGSLLIDDAKNPISSGPFVFVGRTAFSGLNYVTGTRSWNSSDFGSFLDGVFFNGRLFQFSFGLNGLNPTLNSGGFVSSNNALSIQDGFSFRFCNNCVSFDSSIAPGVPEPAAWAMLISGFMLVGTIVRRRRIVGRLEFRENSGRNSGTRNSGDTKFRGHNTN